MTIGELKKILENHPDDCAIRIGLNEDVMYAMGATVRQGYSARKNWVTYATLPISGTQLESRTRWTRDHPAENYFVLFPLAVGDKT